MQHEIIVLGGNGFIGTNLCEALTKAGIKPIVLDKTLGCDLTTEHGQNILRDIICSINHHGSVNIIMLAARIGAKLFDASPIEPFNENLAIDSMTLKTLKSIYADYRTKFKVLYASTSEVYGSLDNVNGVASNRITVDPSYGRSLYAQEKLLFETLLQYERDSENGCISSLAICRFFNVSGKWQKRGVVYEMVKSAVEKKSICYSVGASREITFVQDAIHQLVDLITTDQADGTFDITSKQHIMLSDLAKCIREVLSMNDPLARSIGIEKDFYDSYIKNRGTTNVMKSDDELKHFIEKLISNNTINDIMTAILN